MLLRLSNVRCRSCVVRGFRRGRAETQGQSLGKFSGLPRDITIGRRVMHSMMRSSKTDVHAEHSLAYQPDSEVLLASSFGSQHIWKQKLEDAGLTVRLPGEDCSKVEIGIVFNHPPGVLDQCYNLKAVQSLGAGVDFMMDDPSIVNRGVPLMRIVDPLMAERMATFCVWAVSATTDAC